MTKPVYMKFASADIEAEVYEEAHSRLVEQGIVSPTDEQVEELVAYLYDRAEEARNDWLMP